MVEVVTDQSESSFSTQTTTTYRCTNETCQADMDKKTAARVKLQSERKVAEENRAKVKTRGSKSA
jgi:hypothetical protein